MLKSSPMDNMLLNTIEAEARRLSQETPNVLRTATQFPVLEAPTLSDRHKYILKDFKPFYGKAFVEQAYLAVLKRKPLAQEIDQQLHRMRRRGYGKATILKKLSKSSEGKAKKVRIKGLWLGYGLEILGRIPVISPILMWVWATLTLPSRLAQLQYQLEDLSSQTLENTQALSQASTYNSQQLAQAIEQLKGK